jgi:hypothetical protein
MTIDWVQLAIFPGGRTPTEPESNPTEYGARLLFRGNYFLYRQRVGDLGLPELAPHQPQAEDPDSALLGALASYLAGGDVLPALVPIVESPGATSSARALAAVLAGMAFADRRDLRRSIEVLTSIQDRTKETLAHGWLAAHVAYRLLESGDPARASTMASQVLSLLPAGKLGVAATAIRTAADANNRNARWLLGDFQPMQTWPSNRGAVGPIRDIDYHIEDALTAQLSEQFKSAFESPYTETFSFSAEDPVEGPLSTALFRSEILADWGAATRSRSLIARYQLLTSVGRQDRPVGAAFMFLSRARDDESIARALRVYRAVGPLMQLKGVAESLARLPWPSPQLKADLRILANTADLLDSALATYVADRLLAGWEAVQTRPALMGLVEDVWLQALQAVLPATSDTFHMSVSAWLRHIVETTENPLVLQRVGPVLSTLKWSALGEPETSEWLAFVTRNLTEPSDRQLSAADAAGGLAQTRPAPLRRLLIETYQSTHSLLHAALLVDLARQVPPAILAEVGKDLVQATRAILSQARKGQYSLGIIRTGRLLVTLAQATRSRTIWKVVLEVIGEAAAPPSLRAEALEAMLARPSRTPKWVRLAAKKGITNDGRSFPFESRYALDGAALRFRASFRLAGPEELLSDFVGLATTQEPIARIQAAMSIGPLREIVGLETLAATAVLLSYDTSPDVRAHVAQNLPSLLIGAATHIRRRLVRRLVEMLQDPGSEVPARAISGIWRVAREISDEGAIVRQIESMQELHVSRIVRDLARSAATALAAKASPA